jgi:hypothetical protein
MATARLDKSLKKLQADAVKQTALYESSTEKLYQNFVDAYLWWREAQQEAGYLEGIYQANGIKTRNRNSNRPNFYPLIRLVWNIDVSRKASTVSNWARSMLALDDEYAGHPQRYQSNARDDLINFVYDSGGLGQLRGEPIVTEADLEAEEGIEVQQKKRVKLDAAPDSSIVTQRAETAKVMTAKATLPVFPGAVANDEGFVVLLARRKGVGSLEIVGSDYDAALIQQALLSCTQPDSSSVTPSLRLLVESIQPHALPAHLEKYRDRFFDTVAVMAADADDPSVQHEQQLTSSTTLRVRPQNGDILVSKNHASASLVSLVRPNFQLLDKDEVLLRGADRSWIERELINRQKLMLYRSESDHQLVADQTDRKADYYLPIAATDGSHKRNLYFYEQSKIASQNNRQVIPADESKFVYDWEIRANAHWLHKLDAQCFNRWIAEIKGYFNRQHNSHIQFVVSSTDFTLKHWWDWKKQQYEREHSVALGDDDATIKIRGKNLEFRTHPKDAALVFSALARLPIANDSVVIRANSEIMRIDYATDLAEYRVYIPAADTAGERVSAPFTGYGGA